MGDSEDAQVISVCATLLLAMMLIVHFVYRGLIGPWIIFPWPWIGVLLLWSWWWARQRGSA